MKAIAVAPPRDARRRRSTGRVIEPHGAVLADRFSRQGTRPIPSAQILDVDLMTLLDAEQLAIGTFSPLDGFMTKEDVASVLESYRLTNGVVWPLPILLPTSHEHGRQLRVGDPLALRLRGTSDVYAIMSVTQVFTLHLDMLALGMFGTAHPSHPGVRMLNERGDTFVAGRVEWVRRLPSPHKRYECTPREIRQTFAARGWTRIVGFHTRNAVHRAHEYIQIKAFERNHCDAILIHPVVGPKKSGDYSAEAILRSYELTIAKYYPPKRVVLAAFATYSRYAGPREAVFTALCRKNFGCSHFIVGRDHTGVGDFYRPESSRELFELLGDIGIAPVFFGQVQYCRFCRAHVEHCSHQDRGAAHISGTQGRAMVTAGKAPPAWFMRPDVSDWMIAEIKKGKEIFVV